jgi:ferredoxin-NADP reductase/FAD/FMN-containing dehydrogenase
MKAGWQSALRARFEPEVLQWDEQSLYELSKDFHSFSPILTRELDGKVGQCIVTPRNEEELDGVLSFAAEAGVPLTARGGGTGNYGQCVPLTGGIVLNLAKFQKILEVGDGFMKVQAGAKLGKLESTARNAGQELRIMPSTFQSATIGGFLCGGFGGIGSIRWGTIWDGLVRSLTIKTVETVPRTLRVEGDDVLPYLHTYGTVGILSEVEFNLAPRVEWQQRIISFDLFEEAYNFAAAIAGDAEINKRLVTVIDSSITPYFLPLTLPEGKTIVLLETDEKNEGLLRHRQASRGTVEINTPAENYHQGIGVSDFTWNHTTLWARKTDTRMTYLQIRYDSDRVLEQVSIMRSEHPEMRHHIEFARQNGRLLIAGLPLMPFVSDSELYRLISDCEKNGMPVSNPHTADLEDGGRSFESQKLWNLKGTNDPFELLNQKKLKRPADLTPPPSRPNGTASLTDGRLLLQVTRVHAEAKGVLSVELRSQDAVELPSFTAGAHLGLYLPNGAMRQYSLVNDPHESHRYVIAVALSASGRGGSRYIHSVLRRGDTVAAEPPRNNFPLSQEASRHIFLAGGIGVTPIVSMIRWCLAEKLDWKLIYTAHGRQQAAFLEELVAIGGDRVSVHIPSERNGRRLEVQDLAASLKEDEHLYCCGPSSLMLEVKKTLGSLESQISFEWFGAPELPANQRKPSLPFEIKLRKSGKTLPIPASQSILEVLEDHDFDPPFFCRSGICRTCEVAVCAGTPDHRDFVLSEKERSEGNRMMICVSRAETPALELDL